MPGYMNPYINGNMWNNGFGQYGIYGQSPAPMQQSYTPTAQMPMSSNVIPVDGEVGARAYMVPNGSTGPIALWDTNDSVIYLRTFNSAGMPNPLKKLRYVEEEPVSMLSSGQSGASPQPDMSNYVTKDDLESLRNEIRQMSTTMQQSARGNSAISQPNQQGMPGGNGGNQNTGNRGR